MDLRSEQPDQQRSLEIDDEIDSDPSETLEVQQEKKSNTLRYLWETFQTILLAILLYLAIDFVVARVQVENVSMKPTLHSGEFLMVNRLAYRSGNFQRGDIVVFHSPSNPREDFIKRIIGIPGDIIRIENQQVTINGELQIEPFIAEPVRYTGEWKVPPDSLFVLGDNRNDSYDSHSWGFLPQKNVVGKAILIYWPPAEFRVLQAATP